jgi:integrase/recombinase XerD
MEALLSQFESYLLTEKRVAENTYAAYKRDVGQYASYLKKHELKLEHADSSHIKSFLAHLHEQQVGARSMARKISSLKAFYSYLHDRHQFAHHARDIAIPKLEKKLPLYLSEQEILALLGSTEADVSDVGVRNKVMVYLLYGSGMRISELVFLKKGAIRFDTGFVAVDGKGGKQRMVLLPESTLAMLRDYFDRVYPKLVTKEGVVQETEYAFPIFYGKKLKPISRQAFWVILKKAAEAVGLRDVVSPHRLRHSLATHLLQKGADLRSLQLLLGHEQLSTVQIYTHLDVNHIREVYDKKHPRSK